MERMDLINLLMKCLIAISIIFIFILIAMLLAKEETVKFRFNDQVLVTEGFYQGNTGTVAQKSDWPRVRCTDEDYWVKLDSAGYQQICDHEMVLME